MKGRFKTLTDFIADDLQRMVRYRKSDVKVKVSIKISGRLSLPIFFWFFVNSWGKKVKTEF